MNYRLVSRILGFALQVEAILMLPSMLIGFLTGDDGKAFLLSALITLCLGTGMTLFRKKGAKMQARDGFATVGLAWIFLSACGALPYVLSGVLPNFFDAFFETVSGFTTTGATVLTFVEGQPRGIIFWRSQTQWMGGLGILVLALALIPKMGEGTVQLMRAESPGPIKSKMTPRLGDTARILYLIYIGLTVSQTVCLRLAGMDWYDAICHAMTTISTGGFSTRNASIAYYDSMAIDWIIIIFTFLSGTNFSLLFLALKRQFKTVLRNEEFIAYTAMTVVASALIALDLIAHVGWQLNADTITDSVFQVTTLMSTCGYMTYDYVLWPTFSQIVLMIVMLFGSCAGSTAGGVKQIRLVLLCKIFRRDLHRIMHPRQVTAIRCDGERVEDSVVTSIPLFFFAYIVLLTVGTLITAWDGVDLSSAFGATLTCISNVGPGFGVFGPTGNFSILSNFTKACLSFIMLLGRLEIMPLLLLLFPDLWKNSKNVRR